MTATPVQNNGCMALHPRTWSDVVWCPSCDVGWDIKQDSCWLCGGPGGPYVGRLTDEEQADLVLSRLLAGSLQTAQRDQQRGTPLRAGHRSDDVRETGAVVEIVGEHVGPLPLGHRS